MNASCNFTKYYFETNAILQNKKSRKSKFKWYINQTLHVSFASLNLWIYTSLYPIQVLKIVYCCIPKRLSSKLDTNYGNK